MSPKELQQRIQKMHTITYEEILNCTEDVKKSKLDIKELADVAYRFNEIGKVCKDLQVEADKLSNLAQKLVCLVWMKEDMPSTKIETEDFTAEPDLKMSANIPSRTKDPEAYDALLQWLGVPAELCETELMRIHWPNFKELLTERQKQGKPLPPGVSPEKTHAHYHLKFKPKGASER